MRRERESFGKWEPLSRFAHYQRRDAFARYQQTTISGVADRTAVSTNYAMSVERKKKIKKEREREGKKNSSRRRFSVVIPQLTLMNDLTKHRDRRRRRRGSYRRKCASMPSKANLAALHLALRAKVVAL